jgi:hypothetical protein
MNKSLIQQLIAANRLEEAIKNLLEISKNTHWHDAVILQSTRYQEYRRQ